MSHISYEFLRYSKEDIIINKCEENFIGKDLDFTKKEIKEFINEYQKKI